MKDLTHQERAAIANLLRRRVIELHDRIEQSKSDSQKVALRDEATAYETLAIRFDDGESLVMEVKVPLVPSPDRDTNYLHDAIPVGKDSEPTPLRKAVGTPRRASGHEEVKEIGGRG